MPYVEGGDIRLYYEKHGASDGPAIVFAHGAGGNHLSWWQQVPHFRERYRCVTFDHRGYGLSGESEPPKRGAAYADDLRALLDHLEIDAAHLVAQSMGGWTCVRFALLFPERVRSLVMCDTHGGLTSEAIRQEFASGTRQRMPQPPVHPAAGDRMYRDQPELHFLYTEIDALNQPRTREELGEILRSAGSPSAEEVAAVRVPMLFIVGEEDPLIPPDVIEAAAACFADARVVRVAESGHSVYFEQAERFNEIVSGFLEGAA